MILIDNNISFKLKYVFTDNGVGCRHVEECNLQCSSDVEIWDYAKYNNYAILSKDNDFVELQQRLGFPPKIIVLKCGNKTSKQIKELLLLGWKQIVSFIQSDEIGIIEIG